MELTNHTAEKGIGKAAGKGDTEKRRGRDSTLGEAMAEESHQVEAMAEESHQVGVLGELGEDMAEDSHRAMGLATVEKMVERDGGHN